MMFPHVDGEAGTKMTKLEQQDLVNPELTNNSSSGLEAKEEIPGKAKAQICELCAMCWGKLKPSNKLEWMLCVWEAYGLNEKNN